MTDVDWITKAFHAFAWMAPAFAWMAPGEVKAFELDQLDEAKEWAAG